MKDIEIYTCKATEGNGFEASLLESDEFCSPGIYSDSSKIARLALESARLRGGRIVTLPLCNTLQAEALGAKINLGSKSMPPAVDGYVFSSLSEVDLNKVSFKSERIEATLKAVEELSGLGHTVSFNLDGPVTVLGSIVDPLVLFKSFRKEPLLIKKAVEAVSDSVVALGIEASRRGAEILSYGDSSGTIDILGPKIFGEFCAGPALGILKALSENSSNGITHVCGKTSAGLYKLGLIDFIPIDVSPDRTYGQALEDVSRRGEIKILGNSCMGRSHLKPFSGKIFAVSIIGHEGL